MMINLFLALENVSRAPKLSSITEIIVSSSLPVKLLKFATFQFCLTQKSLVSVEIGFAGEWSKVTDNLSVFNNSWEMNSKTPKSVADGNISGNQWNLWNPWPIKYLIDFWRHEYI